MKKILKINKNIEETVKARYYQENETNIQQVIKRVSDFIAQGEKQFGWSDEQIKKLSDKYYEIFNNRLALPSSPFLMNAGTKMPMVFA